MCLMNFQIVFIIYVSDVKESIAGFPINLFYFGMTSKIDLEFSRSPKHISSAGMLEMDSLTLET